MTFVDLRKAYDTVPKKEQWKGMIEIVITQRLISAVKKLYNKTNMVRVKTGNNYLNNLKTTTSLYQGCSTSQSLFKIFLRQILRPWKRKFEGINDSIVYKNNLFCNIIIL